MIKVLRVTLPMLFVLIVTTLGLSLSINRVEAQQFGSSWTASYFNNTGLSGSPVIAVIDDQINENATTLQQSSSGLVGTQNFSVRWRGLQNFPSSGSYRFRAVYDDGVRVIIDGTTVINDFNNNNVQKVAEATVTITQGSRDITVEYVQFAGSAVVQFYWDPIDVAAVGTAGPTPTPTATGLPPIPAGALTGTVIRAGTLNVRDAPSTGGSVIGRIRRGQTYQIVGRDADARWFVLNLGGYQGWAYGYYLFVNGNEFNAPVVAATNLFGLPAGFNDTGVLAQTNATMRLRAEPNVFSPQIGRVTWGAFLPIGGRTAGGDWYQVLWKGTVGWVYVGYLDIIQGSYDQIPIIR